MKHNIEYLVKDVLFIIKTNGNMSGNGFICMAEEILAHPSYEPNRNTLFDHRALNIDNVTFEDVEQIRGFHRTHESEIGNGKSAILVECIDKWQRLWQQGDKIITENRVNVFDDFDSAMRWLKSDGNS